MHTDACLASVGNKNGKIITPADFMRVFQQEWMHVSICKSHLGFGKGLAACWGGWLGLCREIKNESCSGALYFCPCSFCSVEYSSIFWAGWGCLWTSLLLLFACYLVSLCKVSVLLAEVCLCVGSWAEKSCQNLPNICQGNTWQSWSLDYSSFLLWFLLMFCFLLI